MRLQSSFSFSFSQFSPKRGSYQVKFQEQKHQPAQKAIGLLCENTCILEKLILMCGEPVI